jgi:hypothetical protein
MVQVPEPRIDSLQSAIDSVFAGQEYQWRAIPDPWSAVRRAWTALMDAIDRLRIDNPLAYRLFVWSLIAILALIVLHALWVAARTVRGGSARGTREPEQPTMVVRGASWYAAEAQRLAKEGRYVEAIQADFVRLMLELDGRKAVRFHPSKTPHEYVRDPGLAESSRTELRALVRALYGFAFGRAPCDVNAWESWRQQASTDRYAAAH